MSADVWLTETYFDWLRSEAFTNRVNRREYEGCLRTIHDIPFYWIMWQDENRAGDALSFRQHDFLGFQQDLDSLDQVWLGVWAMSSPSVLEVLLAIARRWSFYFEGSVAYYFGHLFRNMGYDRHPGRVLGATSTEQVRSKTQVWLARQFEFNGVGSPFPINEQGVLNVIDTRTVDIWTQMNMYSAEHFQ